MFAPAPAHPMKEALVFSRFKPKNDGNRDYFMMSDNSHPTLDAHPALAAEIFAKLTAH